MISSADAISIRGMSGHGYGCVGLFNAALLRLGLAEAAVRRRSWQAVAGGAMNRVPLPLVVALGAAIVLLLISVALVGPR